MGEDFAVTDCGQLALSGVKRDREGECGTWARAAAPKERPRRPVIGEKCELGMIDGSSARVMHPTGRVRALLIVLEDLVVIDDPL